MAHVIPFTSIQQFYRTLKDMQDDPTLRSPHVDFTGTVKLHGTNAGVAYNIKDGLWFQSRNQVITVGKDNAGFAKFAHERRKIFEDLIYQVAQTNSVDLNSTTIVLYGEWCGGNIQPNVALTKIAKMFVIFAIKCEPHDSGAAPGGTGGDCGTAMATTDDDSLGDLPHHYYLSLPVAFVPPSGQGIWTSAQFSQYSVTVDLAHPERAQETMTAMTLAVEAECPVAKALGFSGLGEGIVWEHIRLDGARYRFKTKGQKHAETASKVVIPLDAQRLDSIAAFVRATVTPNRVHHAVEHVYRSNPALPTYQQPMSITHFKAIVQWVQQDIVKEESDSLAVSGFTLKQISSELSAHTKRLFLDMLSNF